MIKEDYDKKYRFSLFLPYGLISASAIALTVKQEETSIKTPFDTATTVYDPNIPMQDRVALTETIHASKRRHAKNLIRQGFATEKAVIFGKTTSENVSSYRPTPSAFFYLTGTVSSREEAKRQAMISAMNPNRRKKRRAATKDELEQMDYKAALNDLAVAKDSTPERKEQYRQLLLDSVSYQDFSPLALEPLLAQEVNITPYERGKSLYRDLRLANIETLFRECHFLTSIDRRHIPTEHPATLTSFDDPKKLDIKAFTQYVLWHWYNENPGAFWFTQTDFEIAPQDKEIWRTTPAFYSVQDIPGFSSIISKEKSRIEIPNINNAGTDQLLRHTCSGIGVGKRETYIIHHTRPSKTPWYINIERNTITSTETLFKSFKSDHPILGYGRHIRNAIIVCSSVHHFAELFDKPATQIPGQRNGEKLIARPYDNVNIVLLNSSGVTQLNILMNVNPVQYEAMVKRHLLQKFDCFADRAKTGVRSKDIFSLTYQGTPVFPAYSLNWQSLYWALEAYDAGEKFYVCCYPEQVKFIQKIMPEVEFL